MQRKKILIVEDEESLLKLETVLFSAKGYTVTAVSDGKTALDEIALNKPDLIILDVMIPELDGFEVCRRVKGNPITGSIPVIMLTGKKSPDDVKNGERVGADAYVTKPFKAGVIIEIIEGLLNGTHGQEKRS